MNGGILYQISHDLPPNLYFSVFSPSFSVQLLCGKHYIVMDFLNYI